MLFLSGYLDIPTRRSRDLFGHYFLRSIDGKYRSATALLVSSVKSVADAISMN